VTTIERFPETLAVVKLPPGAEVPRWAESSSVFSITATATETTLVCAARNVPAKTPHERPLTAFRFDGRADAVPEGARVLSTFDVDWVLVREPDSAEEEWRRSGHDVVPATPEPQGNKKK
jgi:uncharacterized protein